MNNTLFVKMVVDQWNAKIKDANAILDQLSDAQLQTDIAPNRNSGTYILGHLTAVHDRMMPLLNLGEETYPDMTETYISNPDKSVPQTLTAGDLRQRWNQVNSLFSDRIHSLSPEDWFQKHSAVSDENFAKEPHRNRLNVLINRTNHLSSHIGQLVLLKNPT